MDLIADLHLHSKYAMGCSNNITIDLLEKYGRIKGIDVLGTGDFQHPEWIKELEEKLSEDGTGILKTEKGFNFLLTTEISLIYTQGGRGRRIHHVILAPDLDTVKQIQEAFLKKGRIDYDGRPIFGFSSIELVDMMRSINPKIEIIPAHAWTSWFAIFGSKSGFDSLKECFEDNTKHIHAIETGMSSDPAMNSMLSQLDGINLVSFSDAHSFWPWRLGREATVFSVAEKSYDNILHAIRTGDGLKSTIETEPAYGKYHLDGHRKCNVCLEPHETKENGTKCPKCGGEMTIGVLNRVLELADRAEDQTEKKRPPYVKLIPLHEILSFTLGKGITTKTVGAEYDKIISAFGTEYEVLLNTPFEKLTSVTDLKTAQMIIKNREAKLQIKPGYDGEYGIIQEEKQEPQKGLSDF